MKLVRGHVGPFMQTAFPGRKRIRTVLLGGEGIMHTPDAKLEMERWGFRPLPGWPASSPDLNPQENVWAWTEKRLRKVEKESDSFTVARPDGAVHPPIWLQYRQVTARGARALWTSMLRARAANPRDSVVPSLYKKAVASSVV